MRHGRIILLTAAVGVFSFGRVLVAQPAGPPAKVVQVQAPPTAPAAKAPTTTPAIPAEADQGKAGPKFRCDELEHDFGYGWAGSSINHTFIIHNDGDAPLEILKVASGCACTVAKDYDKVIAPGKEGKLPFSVKLGSPKNESPKIVSITVTTNDPKNKNPVLVIKGKVKPRISVDPFVGAAFGDVRPGSQETLTRTVTITNNTDEPMTLEELPVAPPQKTMRDLFTVSMKELKPGKVVELTVTATGPAEEGLYVVQLNYKTGVKEESAIQVGCSLTVPSVLEVSPTSLQLTAVPVPSNWMRPIALKYHGEGAMKVTSVTPNNDAISATWSELAEPEPGKGGTIQVKIPPGFDPPADQQLEIVVKTDVAAKPEVKIPIHVTRRIQRPLPPTTPQAVVAESLVGKPAPRETLMSAQGRQQLNVGLGSGKVTVLNFWASWCGSSSQQLPLVQRLAQVYSRKGVDFINVSVDGMTPPPAVLQAASNLGVNLPIALDPQHKAVASYGVKACPTMFLIGANGLIEAVYRGCPRNLEDAKAMQTRLTGELDILLNSGTREDFPTQAPFAGPASPVGAVFGQLPDSTGAPRLFVEFPQQDTGLHKPGATVEYLLQYRNDGLEALTLESVTPSEGLEVEPNYPKTLQRGGLGAMRCRFTAPKQAGQFSHQLAIASNDSARPVTQITLTGTVRPYLEVNPPTGIDFPRSVVRQVMPQMATITYNGTENINYLSAESSSPQFKATADKIQNGPNAKVIITAQPPLDLGENRAVVTVRTDCQEQPTVEIPVSLVVPPRIDVVPTEITLSTRRQVQRQTVSIANNTGESLHILGLEKSSPRIYTQFYPEPDGLSYRLRLTFPSNFRCVPEGEKVTIRTDDKEMREIVISIRPADTAKAVSTRP